VRATLLDVPLDLLSLEEALGRMEGFIAEGRPRQVATVNLDFLRLSRSDDDFRRLLQAADLVVPDGAPVAWALRLRGWPARRLTGIELVEGCARLSHERGYRLFFLGGSPGAAEAAIDRLGERYPRMQVAGCWAPDVADARVIDSASARRVGECRADCVFVAFGCPKQDYWIATHKALANAPVAIGVGGTFRVLGGLQPRAPAWMQAAGLEWLHRLGQEPGRLWKRYLLHDLRLAPALFSHALWGRITAGRTMPIDG
jgi:N-acetylglucosaminyldiphosphoundecaprenol N-acetyl-beta-D-mannosaminyltransferase